jgi:hypothetical protein
MIRGKTYHTMTDSMTRTKEDWFDEIPKHVQDFLSAGGKIYQAADGESAYKKPAFVINSNKGFNSDR